MEVVDEQKLSGNLSGFEAYMFATVEKHMARHTSFQRFGIGIAADGKCVQYDSSQAVMQKFRSSKLREFNKVLSEHGFDHTHGNKFSNTIVYLEDEYDDLDNVIKYVSDVLSVFSSETGAVCAYCVHSDQVSADYKAVSPVHIHVIYAVKKRQDNLLRDYLLSD